MADRLSCRGRVIAVLFLLHLTGCGERSVPVSSEIRVLGPGDSWTYDYEMEVRALRERDPNGAARFSGTVTKAIVQGELEGRACLVFSESGNLTSPDGRTLPWSQIAYISQDPNTRVVNMLGYVRDGSVMALKKPVLLSPGSLSKGATWITQYEFGIDKSIGTFVVVDAEEVSTPLRPFEAYRIVSNDTGTSREGRSTGTTTYWEVPQVGTVRYEGSRNYESTVISYKASLRSTTVPIPGM